LLVTTIHHHLSYVAALRLAPAAIDMKRYHTSLPTLAATWVHYNTFVKLTTVSVSKLLYMYKLLDDEERREFLEKITQIASANQELA
jgi:hypothetical protein